MILITFLMALILFLFFYFQLGWYWTMALMKLDEAQRYSERNYCRAFLFWPLSMMQWDIGHQEAGYDD